MTFYSNAAKPRSFHSNHRGSSHCPAILPMKQYPHQDVPAKVMSIATQWARLTATSTTEDDLLPTQYGQLLKRRTPKQVRVWWFKPQKYGAPIPVLLYQWITG